VALPLEGSEGSAQLVPFDFKSLKPVASPAMEPPTPDEADVVEQRVVRLREGCEAPPYIAVRARFGTQILTADVRRGDLRRLEEDPAIARVDPPEPYKLID
jgi:hypothetical protein